MLDLIRIFSAVVGDNNTDTILPNSAVQFTLNIAAEYGYVATGADGMLRIPSQSTR